MEAGGFEVKVARRKRKKQRLRCRFGSILFHAALASGGFASADSRCGQWTVLWRGGGVC